MKNGIGDLRNHLFDVIERLKDPQPETPIDIESAQVICLAAKRLIETAEVEIKFRQIVGKEMEASEFLEMAKLEKLPHKGSV